MKRLIMAVLAITVSAGLYAQTFFAEKQGMVLTYAENDARGKTGGYTVMTIKEVKGSGRNMTITYGVEVLDKNRKKPKNSPGEIIYQIVIENGVVIMDINQMIPPGLMEQGIQIEISGSPIEIPNNLAPGQKLKDSEIIVTVDMGIIKMTTVTKTTNGECLAIEDVTVPAGTFKCHKITQTATTTAMRKDTVTKTISWYAPGIGTVKTEIYDSKNKLTSGTVLVEVTGN